MAPTPFTLLELKSALLLRFSGLSVESTAQTKRMNAVEVLALTIFGEARNESIDGRVAVAQTVRNRSLTRGKSVDERCLQKSQYSCWFPYGGEANYNRLMALAERVITHQPLGADTALFNECKWIATGVIDGQARDRTHGATHYLTSQLFYSPQCPAWAKEKPATALIGAHMFFAGIAWS